MIISRTPFRVSFVGGGTDLKSFYLKEDGRVLSTAIDKYIYVAVKRQTGIVEHKYRISWDKVEFKKEIDDIENPIVRETLKFLEIDYPLEVTTFGDVPASTGLGSSSSFVVGLVHALYALKGQMITKSQLAQIGSHIEINILKRVIGSQDHYAAAYGDLNIFTFHANGAVSVEPVFYRPEVKSTLEKNLMLFYTALKRDASKVLAAQNRKTDEKFDVLRKMKNLVTPLQEVISSGVNLNQFGEMLHNGWLLKKSITSGISSPQIEKYYQKAIDAGALGGKLLGAGGGGFLLFYVEPQNQANVAKSLSNLPEMKFRFDIAGSRITYYDQTDINI